MNRAFYRASFLFLTAGIALGGCKTPPPKSVAPRAVFYPAKLEAIDEAIERAIAADKAPGAVVRLQSGGFFIKNRTAPSQWSRCCCR